MNSPGVVALIGVGGVIVGALVGLLSSVWTTKIADRHAMQEREQNAYLAFIIALDHFDELWAGPAKQYDDTTAKPLGPQTNKCAEAIQIAFAAVLLSGSKVPRQAADVARHAAWAIADRLSPPPGWAPRTTDPLPTLIEHFRCARHVFESAVPSR
jgi:hypothetical protein